MDLMLRMQVSYVLCAPGLESSFRRSIRLLGKVAGKMQPYQGRRPRPVGSAGVDYRTEPGFRLGRCLAQSATWVEPTDTSDRRPSGGCPR